MKNASAKDFVDHTTYEECAVIYNGTKYFFHGAIFDQEKNKYTYDIAIWNDKNEFVNFILTEEYDSVLDCLDRALEAPIFEGKTFWEAEKDMEWIDW